MKIDIIAPPLPPQIDGIGSYTACLAKELAQSVEVKVWTVLGHDYNPIPGVTIIPAFSAEQTRSIWDVVRQIENDPPDWVVLQYNPFSYGRWGLNLHLPLALRKLRQCCPQVRFALMAHECFVPVINAKFAIMTVWQRWQIWHLGRTADVIFASIEAWTERFQRWFPDKRCVHLPVGSNIPHIETSRAEARAVLGIPAETIVLGVFGGAHPSRMLPWIAEAAHAVCAQGNDVLVLSIGSGGAEIRRALGNIPLCDCGPLPEEEVSRRLTAVDIYLTPFIDGVSTRRGSFITGLQHGLATVGTLGPLTDGLLKTQNGQAFLLSEVSEQADFCRKVLSLASDVTKRQALSTDARTFYHHEFSWERIAARLLMS